MTEGQQAMVGQAAEADAAAMSLVMDRLRSEQNLSLGIAAGAVGSVAGAAVWAAITVFTRFQIGWMAVGVGFLVGLAIRAAGKGIDKAFGFAGAGLALAGCLLGNLLAACGMLSRLEGIPFFDILSGLDAATAQALMSATFSPMDLLFYGIAVYEGYKLSFRQISPDEMTRRLTG